MQSFAENTYYQLAPGRYIFPGAEVYSEPEDYDQCSLSANSESTDSDTDSSSGEEEEDEEEETCKFHLFIFLFFLCQNIKSHLFLNSCSDNFMYNLLIY